MENIVIIGTGLAGYNLGREIRKLDKNVELVMITADGGESYSKPMLSNALSKGKTVAQLVMATAGQMEQQNAATIKTNTLVEAIDTEAHRVRTSAGDVPYGKLVLATGASQLQPTLKGNAVDKVITVNNLKDYDQFRTALDAAQHVAIIGAGLVGCEFANDLVSIDKKVTVIGPGHIPLGRLLPEAVGEYVMRQLANAGIQFRMGVSATEVNKHNSHYAISFSDGSQLQADLVMSAIGLKPNVSLAQKSGAQVNRGIVANRYLQTSLPDVYTLGDCAEVEGMVLPFVLPLMNAARTLAKTLTGTATPLQYPAMPVVIKTPAHPIIVSPPAKAAQGDWKVEIDDTGAKAVYRDSSGALLGFVLTGNKVNEKPVLSKQLPDVLS